MSGLKTRITTNFTLFNRNKTELIDNIDCMHISIPVIQPSKYREISGSKKNFFNIKFFAGHKISCFHKKISHCEYKLNCASTKAIWCYPDYSMGLCPQKKSHRYACKSNDEIEAERVLITSQNILKRPGQSYRTRIMHQVINPLKSGHKYLALKYWRPAQTPTN